MSNCDAMSESDFAKGIVGLRVSLHGIDCFSTALALLTLPSVERRDSERGGCMSLLSFLGDWTGEVSTTVGRLATADEREGERMLFPSAESSLREEFRGSWATDPVRTLEEKEA